MSASSGIRRYYAITSKGLLVGPFPADPDHTTDGAIIVALEDLLNACDPERSHVALMRS